jgi:ferredoxin
MAKQIARIQVLRKIILGLMLLALTVLGVLHQKMQGIPSVDALDPFGGLETLLKLVARGEFIKKIEPGTVVLFCGTVALGIVISRFFCGWLCAFGALQGVFGWIGKRAFGKRFAVPAKLDHALRFVKYPLLIAIVALTWYTGTLVIRPYDPLAAYAHIAAGPAALIAEFAVGTFILIVTLVLSAVFGRVFCKYLCPLGALNALLGRIPIFRIKRNADTCVSCAKCDHACPMNITVSSVDTVKSPECIACLECVSACPTRKDTLTATLFGKPVKKRTVALLGLAIFALAALLGRLTGNLTFVPPDLKELAAEKKLSVADIKGSSTWAAVAEAFGVDLERLYRETGIDGKTVPPETMLKDSGRLAGIADFETDTVRQAIARITGLPYTGETESGGQTDTDRESAVGTTEAATGTEDTRALARESTASGPAPASLPATAITGEPATGAETIVVPADFRLEGTMTVNDVAHELRVPAETVIERLGLDAGISRDTPLRDMKDRYGYTLPELRERLAR